MPYKFFAFISYRHTDIKIARRLQFLLESYSLPAAIQKTHPSLPKKFKIFRDRDELTTGELNAAIHSKLENSKYLIVICSPQSAESKYVGDEIAYFRSLGREKNIIPFIVSGVPHNPACDCFHPELTRGGLEMLGIDIQTEDSRFKEIRFHKAFVRLVAALLGLDYGVLWDRRKHFLIKLAATLTLIVALLTTLAFTAFRAQPFDAAVRLQAEAPHLPLSATGTDSLRLYLHGDDVRSKAVTGLGETIEFPNIPGKYEGETVRMVCNAYGFRPLDTTLVLTPGISLRLNRLPETFGRLRYQVADNDSDRPLAGAVFDFGFMQATTGPDGRLDVLVPLGHQQETYPVSISYQGQPMHLTYGEQGDVLRPMDSKEVATLYVEK